MLTDESGGFICKFILAALAVSNICHEAFKGNAATGAGLYLAMDGCSDISQSQFLLVFVTTPLVSHHPGL
jgi:hypothetical protein